MGEGDQVAQNLAEELTTRTRQLRELEQRQEQRPIDVRFGGSGSAVLERARSRAYDGLLKTNEPVKFKPIDVPHSHEEELRLDRLAREQREGGIVLQSNQMTPARPSTTLTESLTQQLKIEREQKEELMSDLEGIQETMERMGIFMANIDDDMVRMGRTINTMSEETRLEQIAREGCLLYTSPSPRDRTRSRMPSSA